MDTWYTVNYGAMVAEKIFDTYEDAEIYALALAVATGDHWYVQFVCGMAI